MSSEEIDKSEKFSFLFACFEVYHDLILENTFYINLKIPPWRVQIPTVLRQSESEDIKIDSSSNIYCLSNDAPDNMIYINYELLQFQPKFVHTKVNLTYYLYTMDYLNYEMNSRHKLFYEMFIDKSKNNEAGIRSTCLLVPNVLTKRIMGLLEHLSDFCDSIKEFEDYNSLFRFKTFGNN